MAKQKKTRVTTEELVARIEARQEQNRAARATKVTADDVRQRLEERRAQKRASGQAPVGSGARKVSIGIGIALLVGVGATATITTSSTHEFSREHAEVQQQIAAARGELDAVPAATRTEAARYEADLSKQIADATQKGEKVAALQQEFQSILHDRTGAQPTNGAADPATQAAAEHRRTLAPYFVDRALIADDAEAYAPGSVLPFDDDQIDPRFPWFIATGSDQITVSPASTSTWSLMSVVATQTPGVLEATWLDRSVDGDLFAWATASYYVDGGKFGSLKVGTTTLGSRNTMKTQKAGE